MLAELLRAQPSLRGILVDLPRTVARSGEVFRAAGVAERVVAVGQSFFDPLPRGADLYLLRGVPNDFPDREATAVLGRCAEAVSPDGRIIILKSVGADDAWKRLTIELVLLGGRHRELALSVPGCRSLAQGSSHLAISSSSVVRADVKSNVCSSGTSRRSPRSPGWIGTAAIEG